MWILKREIYVFKRLGPVSLTVFPSQFKFDGNFVSLSPRLHYRDRYKILYMARQLCCRGMCKNLLRSDGQQRSYGKAKFPSYLNCGLKTVSETGPWSPGLVLIGFIFIHDDVIKWKYFPRYWPLVRGIHRSPVNSPHKGQWRGALMFSLICIWINGWVNNREAGDLRCYRGHYNVDECLISFGYVQSYPMLRATQT